MAGEFNLIEKYFVARQPNRADVILAAGDDCAIVSVAQGQHVAISTDTLVAGTHFLADADPAMVAHKALASNISDLAAMGATPAWVSFALTMPEVDEAWLKPFCDSFFALADQFNIQLIGGDTTKGPLSLTLTVQGLIPSGQSLRRDNAQVGDRIYVTGDLGDSKAGLDVILDPSLSTRPFAQQLMRRHYLSTPQIALGEALRGIASAAIDISDGLISDLQHILRRSGLGARVDIDTLPFSQELCEFIGSREGAQRYALTSGEEYELCFTVPDSKREEFEQVISTHAVKVSCIGQTCHGSDIELHQNSLALDWQLSGYDHFKVGL
ncbi:thiamine-phosphate kinase [Vibrio sp. TRT 21S02]|uniref:thiamine-phosphate kinase n=1 Tax=Vibrio sp. TRT 21S02 TaxID=3418507 RepID=UPI003CF9F092